MPLPGVALCGLSLWTTPSQTAAAAAAGPASQPLKPRRQSTTNRRLPITPQVSDSLSKLASGLDEVNGPVAIPSTRTGDIFVHSGHAGTFASSCASSSSDDDDFDCESAYSILLEERPSLRHPVKRAEARRPLQVQSENVHTSLAPTDRPQLPLPSRQHAYIAPRKLPDTQAPFLRQPPIENDRGRPRERPRRGHDDELNTDTTEFVREEHKSLKFRRSNLASLLEQEQTIRECLPAGGHMGQPRKGGGFRTGKAVSMYDLRARARLASPERDRLQGLNDADFTSFDDLNCASVVPAGPRRRDASRIVPLRSIRPKPSIPELSSDWSNSVTIPIKPQYSHTKEDLMLDMSPLPRFFREPSPLTSFAHGLGGRSEHEVQRIERQVEGSLSTSATTVTRGFHPVKPAAPVSVVPTTLRDEAFDTGGTRPAELARSTSISVPGQSATHAELEPTGCAHCGLAFHVAFEPRRCTTCGSTVCRSCSFVITNPLPRPRSRPQLQPPARPERTNSVICYACLPPLHKSACMTSHEEVKLEQMPVLTVPRHRASHAALQRGPEAQAGALRRQPSTLSFSLHRLSSRPASGSTRPLASSSRSGSESTNVILSRRSWFTYALFPVTLVWRFTMGSALVAWRFYFGLGRFVYPSQSRSHD